MRFNRLVWTVCLWMVLPAVFAKPSLDERMTSLERKLANDKITIETLNEIDHLKNDLQKLQGKIEEQQHTIEQLQKKQLQLLGENDQEQLQNKTEIPSDNVADEQQPTAKLNSSTEVSERELYEQVYQLVESRDYEEAKVALQDFLWKFPEGEYTANAYYWLGEIYLHDWNNNKSDLTNLSKAKNCYNTIVSKYIMHQKGSDSLLKLGTIAFDLGEIEIAKQYFQELKQKFPNSSKASIADLKLKQMANTS